ncbi:hypothetical protein [Rivularia sp. UHCC 0363]|uniref:hypothetical protein n=1 Tax=Rivularia sp. UHCC 0363 TaxID=3110244 RepID=UPI002B1EA5FD|nr:hypothetical protein [Rivularia sp. UHCC 0363]MEA5595149.1 hypothetical protein [Rivularia sp. UHCC 0363]
MIKISIYHPQYQNQVAELILKIQQQEFGVSITLEDQSDLLNIPDFYQQGNGNFWVALDEDNVVATIAAIDIDNKYLALRKMFVNVIKLFMFDYNLYSNPINNNFCSSISHG